jgi:hypothetical protein
MDFKVGDKIYKLLNNGELDKTKIFEIKSITQNEDGNWHDGYSTFWVATLVGEDKLFIITYKSWGSNTSNYAVKVE